MVDLRDRHHQRVPGTQRSDRQEHHAPVVAPDEASRQLALDDPREDGCHRSSAPHRRLRAMTGPAEEQHEPGSDRILTIPNIITVVRLLCLPLFLWLLFAKENRAAAAALLGALGATDFLDGYIARHFNQASDLGKILDPVADRLLFFVGAGGILIDGSVPVWYAVAILVREVIVAGATLAPAAVGARPLDGTGDRQGGTVAHKFALPPFLPAGSTGR